MILFQNGRLCPNKLLAPQWRYSDNNCVCQKTDQNSFVLNPFDSTRYITNSLFNQNHTNPQFTNSSLRHRQLKIIFILLLRKTLSFVFRDPKNFLIFVRIQHMKNLKKQTYFIVCIS